MICPSSSKRRGLAAKTALRLPLSARPPLGMPRRPARLWAGSRLKRPQPTFIALLASGFSPLITRRKGLTDRRPEIPVHDVPRLLPAINERQLWAELSGLLGSRERPVSARLARCLASRRRSTDRLLPGARRGRQELVFMPQS